MASDDKTPQERAHDRRNWPVHVHKLGQEPGDDLSASTTAEERLAMMWELAITSYTLTGQPLPNYTRANMPATIIRGRKP